MFCAGPIGLQFGSPRPRRLILALSARRLRDQKEDVLKKVLLVTLLLLHVGLGAQQPAAPASSDIPFDVQDVLKMPPDLYLGEIAGVALNSRRHIFVYTRTGADDGSTILAARMARLFEFN